MTAATDLGFAHRAEPGTSQRTLLLLHGTGGDEHQLIPLGRDLVPAATLLSPRGKVLEDGRLPRFFARRGIGDLDLDDLRARADELATFVTGATDAYGLDRDGVTALGFSNGANIAVALLLRHPGLLRGAVLLRPMLPYVPDELPALAGTRVLIGAGSADPYSGPAQTGKLAELLRRSGAEVEVAMQRAGHELTREDIEAARRWLS